MPITTSRRRFLTRATAFGSGAALGFTVNGLTFRLPQASADGSRPCDREPYEPSGAFVSPDDPRYPDLVRGWNGRFIGTPDYVRVVTSTSQVAHALAEAVATGKRPAVRSGGHCLEDFVTNPGVRVVIDMSPMNRITYDRQRNAIMVEPGATLRQVYKTLYTRWGVTVPGGICPSVGAGGHFAGGGYGPLARRLGIVPDYIAAVEVVTVDRFGNPRRAVASSERDDPNRELWWAHTGGGGGNFGIVTRYWLRAPGSRSSEPVDLLPAPPRMTRLTQLAFPWAALDQTRFRNLLLNYIHWYEAHSAPGAAESRLAADFFGLHQASSPAVAVNVSTDPTESDADALVANFRSALEDGVGTPLVSERVLPWLQSTNAIGYADTGDVVGRRSKAKGTYLRRAWSDAQVATTYRYLTETNIEVPLAGVLIGAYGGQAGAVHPDATATPQRDSILKVLHTIHWADPALDASSLAWVREFYREVNIETGGVPDLDGVSDGSYINYADVDLADPAWNTSGIPWHDLYYKQAYPRLQEVKAKWDPRGVFQHALSVQPPS